LPIRRVRSDGTVDVLGSYEHSTRTLRLDAPGFPLLGPGAHVVEGDLPWQFYEMAPSGHLGRLFSTWHPELELPRDPSLWSAEHVLTAIALRGEDLPGSVIVGDASLARRTVAPAVPDLRSSIAATLVVAGRDGSSSSVGGERPKLAIASAAGGALAKFSPPIDTLLGRRWADLLRVERHCSDTISTSHTATSALAVLIEDRMVLIVGRFDRLPHDGRRGAVTWFHLGATLYGEASGTSAPIVAEALARDGHINADELATFRTVHAFSASIGNNDAHLGNYGLTIDDEGKTALAPIYDVLPMAFAPRLDELPDAYVTPFAPPADARVRALVDDLVARVESDGEISREFVALWKSKLA
jgi:hypothetical protein